MAKKELRHYAAQDCERVLADIANLAGKVILLNEPSSGKGKCICILLQGQWGTDLC